jgi:hypothetical protein
MPELLSLLLHRGVLGFLAGSVVTAGLLWAIGRNLTPERVQNALDILDEHKDDIAFGYIILAVVTRSIFVSNAKWIEVLNTGELSLLALGIGGGIGMSRLAKNYQKEDLSARSTGE